MTPGGVLVAVGDELEEAGGDPRLDDTDPHPVARRDEPVLLGRQLDGVAGVHLGELAGVRQVCQEGEAGLARLLDEDRDRGLAARLGRNGVVAGVDEEHPKAVDIPLGDPVRRIQGEGGLVVLPRGAELAELPERLRQAVLRLGVRPELEQPTIRLDGLRPLGRGRLGDRLVSQLALEARLVDGARWLGIDFGEGHEEDVLSGWREHSFLASPAPFVKPQARMRTFQPTTTIPSRTSRSVCQIQCGSRRSDGDAPWNVSQR